MYIDRLAVQCSVHKPTARCCALLGKLNTHSACMMTIDHNIFYSGTMYFFEVIGTFGDMEQGRVPFI
jgi:hypothetical protein